MSKICNECSMISCSYEPYSAACQSAREFLIDEEKNKKYLDTLDLSKYISQSKDIDTIIDLIKKDYDNNPNLPEILEGCIFNHLGKEDIAYYLAKRYGFYVNEQIIYKYTLYK